jgi:CopG family nickel-responsive transcriptional regulator
MAEETVRFTVSLPASLLDEMDARMVSRGYASRSELVRDLIRDRLGEERWATGEEEVNGVLTILYDHHRRGLTGRIVDAQHSHLVNVLCSTHVHVSHHLCLEAIILKGRPAEIQRMALKIGGLKGVQSARLSRVVAGE